MKFLKGVALSLLGALLFLSLSSFGFVWTMHQTLLNPQFAVDELNQLNLRALAKELVAPSIPPQQQFILPALDAALVQVEPWMKEQTKVVVPTAYDYFLGKKPDLNINVNLQPVKDTLKNAVKQQILKSPPPELAPAIASAPPAMIDQVFDQYYQQLMSQMQIPDRWVVNSNQLGPDARQTVSDIRQYVNYIQTAYPVLIAVIALCVLGIVLIQRQVKGATRNLGSIFLTSGIFGYASNFLMNYAMGGLMPSLGLPSSSLLTWVTRFLADVMAPWDKFNIAVAVVGLVLVIVSFVYRKRQPAEAPLPAEAPPAAS